jgi:hypothetical protein
MAVLPRSGQGRSAGSSRLRPTTGAVRQGLPMNDDALLHRNRWKKDEIMNQVIEFHARTTRAALLKRWPFLKIEQAEDIEAIVLRGRADPSGPSIVFSTTDVEPDLIDDPSTAVLWLAPCLMQIASALIAGDLATHPATSHFTSHRWTAFRETAASEMAMSSWAKVLECAEREGVDFTSEHLATCMTVESGLHEELERLSAA